MRIVRVCCLVMQFWASKFISGRGVGKMFSWPDLYSVCPVWLFYHGVGWEIAGNLIVCLNGHSILA